MVVGIQPLRYKNATAASRMTSATNTIIMYLRVKRRRA